jgi:glycosyltransferase involved in cell wall biosynthesis
MSQEPKNQSYQEALLLAERGQYEQALGMIHEYIRSHPDDGEALNDAGTILFCMQRGSQAIEYFEKARGLLHGNLAHQCLWNLSEAYIQEDQPAEAYKLFDVMAEAGILNADVLNRTADAFLAREALGGAIECMLWSNKISPQEILEPMLKVVRSRRVSAVVAGDEDCRTLQHIRDYLEPRFRSECIVGNSKALSSTQAEVVIAVGTGRTLREIAANKGTRKLVVVLRPQDVHAADLESVDWTNADMVFVCGTSAQMDILTDRLPNLGRQTVVQSAAVPFTTDGFTFAPRGRGKKLACIGPFDAHHNPVLLLQCMQKLHYLDADYRLYFAGEFQDKAVEQYCRWMTARMNLEGVVFFEGPVSNIEKWLRDKHTVVSSAIDAGGVDGVWTAMACGLRPVVHAFAGSAECVPQSAMFDIAEDFCNQLRHGDSAGEDYRSWLEKTLKHGGFDTIFTAGLLKLERQIHLSIAPRREAATPVAAVRPVAQQQTLPAFIPAQPAPKVHMAFASEAVTPTHVPAPLPKMNLPWENMMNTPAPAAPAIPVPPPASPVVGKTVNEVAEEALKASQRLREILQQSYAREEADRKQESLASPFAR